MSDWFHSAWHDFWHVQYELRLGWMFLLLLVATLFVVGASIMTLFKDP